MAEKKQQRFPILKNHNLGMVYIGKYLNDCVDSEQAFYRWKAQCKGVEDTNAILGDYEIDVYGTKTKFKFPLQITPPNAPEEKENTIFDVTQEWLDYVSQSTKDRKLNDRTLGVRSQLFKRYKILIDTQTNRNRLDNRHGSINAAYENDVDYASLVMMREHLDGFTAPNNMLITNQMGDKEEFEMLTSYTVRDPRDHARTIEISNDYCAGLRYLLFNPVLQAWNLDQRHADQQRKRFLQMWQYDIVKRMGSKRTCYSAPRRSGKTLMLVYLVLRAMFRHNPRAALRPTTILYVGLEDDRLRPVRDYIKACIKNFGPYSKLFKRSNKDKIFQLIDPVTKDVFAQIIFITAGANNPAVGDFADLVIFDEAVLIPHKVFDRIYSIVDNEDCDMICTSTLYYDIPQGWFNDLLIEYEQESMLRIDIDNLILDNWDIQKPLPRNAGLRYTIEDVETITESRKIEIINSKIYQSNFVKLATELYSRTPTVERTFNFEGSILEKPILGKTNPNTGLMEGANDSARVATEKLDFLIFSYDPARTSDHAALIPVGYSRKRNCIIQFDEITLNTVDKASYIPQAEQALKFIQGLTDRANVSYFVIDVTGHDGVADLFQAKGIYIWKRFRWTGGDVLRERAKYKDTLIPKNKMVEVLQMMFDMKKLYITANCHNTIEELSNYYGIELPTGGRQYGAQKSKHDDHVSALMMGVFTLYELLGVKHGLGIQVDPLATIHNENEITQELIQKQAREKRELHQKNIDLEMTRSRSEFI